MESTTRTRLDAVEAAREYLRRGWMPVPVHAREKRPVPDAWQRFRVSEAEVPRHFSPGCNTGLLLGEPSGWLVDVDLDCAEARELAAQYLPPTPVVTGRPSSPESHYWYIAEGAATKQFRDRRRNKVMMLELRSTGTQTVVGPSIHPSGEPQAPLADQ